MNDYKDLPRSIIDYVRGAYKRALQKEEPTLPFSLLKVAVQRAQTELNKIVAANTIRVTPQQRATYSMKDVDAEELRTTEAGPAGRKAAKGKGKAKEVSVAHDVDRLPTTDKAGRSEEQRAADTKARKATEKRAAGTAATKASRGRTGADVGRSTRNDPQPPKAAKGTAPKVPFVLLIKRGTGLRKKPQGKPRKPVGGEKTGPGGSRRPYKSRSVVESSVELTDEDADGDSEDDGPAPAPTRTARGGIDDDQPEEDEDGFVAARLPRRRCFISGKVCKYGSAAQESAAFHKAKHVACVGCQAGKTRCTVIRPAESGAALTWDTPLGDMAEELFPDDTIHILPHVSQHELMHPPETFGQLQEFYVRWLREMRAAMRDSVDDTIRLETQVQTMHEDIIGELRASVNILKQEILEKTSVVHCAVQGVAARMRRELHASVAELKEAMEDLRPVRFPFVDGSVRASRNGTPASELEGETAAAACEGNRVAKEVVVVQQDATGVPRQVSAAAQEATAAGPSTEKTAAGKPASTKTSVQPETDGTPAAGSIGPRSPPRRTPTPEHVQPVGARTPLVESDADAAMQGPGAEGRTPPVESVEQTLGAQPPPAARRTPAVESEEEAAAARPPVSRTPPGESEDDGRGHSEGTVSQGKRKRGEEANDGETPPADTVSGGGRSRKVAKTAPAGDQPLDENIYGRGKRNVRPADVPVETKKKSGRK